MVGEVYVCSFVWVNSYNRRLDWECPTRYRMSWVERCSAMSTTTMCPMLMNLWYWCPWRSGDCLWRLWEVVVVDDVVVDAVVPWVWVRLVPCRWRMSVCVALGVEVEVEVEVLVVVDFPTPFCLSTRPCSPCWKTRRRQFCCYIRWNQIKVWKIKSTIEEWWHVTVILEWWWWWRSRRKKRVEKSNRRRLEAKM